MCLNCTTENTGKFVCKIQIFIQINLHDKWNVFDFKLMESGDISVISG